MATDIHLEAVPVEFREKVCECGSRPDGFTLNQQLNWYVCAICNKPAPLNALRARLIRECEICEEDYFVTRMPDRMDLCEDCR